MTPQGITILGATGSIGTSTLDVIARYPDAYRVVALSGYGQVERLFEQCQQFRPQYAVTADATSAAALNRLIRQAGLATEILYGPEALVYIATLTEIDVVMAAIVGAVGLSATMAAAHAGKRILLANKESLVMAGHLFMAAVRTGNATLLPVDSEHSAILQALPTNFAGDLDKHGINKLILTASGGPFRTWSIEEMQAATVDDACRHPNWVMGPKISVDCATLMNKGLEVIEAHWLFNAPAERVEVVVHPQSIIHSMVQYCDGSVVAQLGMPDMRTPIALALAWPRRIQSGVSDIDFCRIAALTFEQPDMNRFPCLQLAYDALRCGGDAATVLNAANEIAVKAFLAHKIRLTDIPNLIEAALSAIDLSASGALDALLAKDAETRSYLSSRVVTL